MPIKTIQVRTRAPLESELMERLIAEWAKRDPRAADNQEQPDICEGEHDGKVIKLCVVWKEWAGLDVSRRGELILDAYERVTTPEAALRIQDVLGITPEENARGGWLSPWWRG